MVDSPKSRLGAARPKRPKLEVSRPTFPTRFADQQKQSADFVKDLILELRVIAKAARLYDVVIPLEFAYYAAYGVAHGAEPTEHEIAHVKELSMASTETDAPPDVNPLFDHPESGTRT
jgi:hypothetical protein